MAGKSRWLRRLFNWGADADSAWSLAGYVKAGAVLAIAAFNTVWAATRNFAGPQLVWIFLFSLAGVLLVPTVAMWAVIGLRHLRDRTPKSDTAEGSEHDPENEWRFYASDYQRLMGSHETLAENNRLLESKVRSIGEQLIVERDASSKLDERLESAWKERDDALRRGTDLSKQVEDLKSANYEQQATIRRTCDERDALRRRVSELDRSLADETARAEGLEHARKGAAYSASEYFWEARYGIDLPETLPTLTEASRLHVYSEIEKVLPILKSAAEKGQRVMAELSEELVDSASDPALKHLGQLTAFPAFASVAAITGRFFETVAAGNDDPRLLLYGFLHAYRRQRWWIGQIAALLGRNEDTLIEADGWREVDAAVWAAINPLLETKLFHQVRALLKNTQRNGYLEAFPLQPSEPRGGGPDPSESVA